MPVELLLLVWLSAILGLAAVVAVIGAIAVIVIFGAKHTMSQAEVETLRERCTSSEKENGKLAAKVEALTAENQELREENEKLEILSQLDPLTKLPNSRSLEQHLEVEIPKAVRLGLGIGVLFMDLDGFKAVNDRLGHAFGDQVLKRLAATLTQAARVGETVARVGGDEFVVVLIGVNEKDLLLAGRRFRRLIEQEFNLDSNPLTASIGAAEMLLCLTTEALVWRADQAMYAAKAAGGNSVKLYQAA